MAYLKTPNLPDGKVTAAFIDSRMSTKCRRALENLGIQAVPLVGTSKLAYPVSSHPDMLCMHIGGKSWVFNGEIYEKNRLAIDCQFLDITVCRETFSPNYPLNVLYNGCIVGKKLFCKSTSMSAAVLNEAEKAGITIINVKQGYAKCSICVVDEKSIITSDYSVHEVAGRSGIDSLLIGVGHIRLDGYEYGFIGGCGIKLDRGLLAFCGNIEAHPDYRKIRDFTKTRKVDIISLTDEMLYDYGSVLPVCSN